MEIWNETAWYVELVFNTLLFVLPTLAGVAVSGALGLRIIRIVRTGWRDVVRQLVDEPTDPAVIFIAAKAGRTPQQVSKFLVEQGDQIVALLPEESKPQGG